MLCAVLYPWILSIVPQVRDAVFGELIQGVFLGSEKLAVELLRSPFFLELALQSSDPSESTTTAFLQQVDQTLGNEYGTSLCESPVYKVNVLFVALTEEELGRG